MFKMSFKTLKSRLAVVGIYHYLEVYLRWTHTLICEGYTLVSAVIQGEVQSL
ncbi:UNVERIFIED_CONTAM: hypothetical protein FKN15_020361 [Acipenser sinensis]